MKGLKRRLSQALLVLNFFIAISLLLAYACRFISPETFPHLALFGLLYPAWFAVNGLFAMWWLTFGKRRNALLSVLVILLGIPVHLRFWNPALRQAPAAQTAMRLVSYNVKLFDVYPTSPGRSLRDSIVDLMSAQHADIYAFQEYYRSDRNPEFHTKQLLQQQLGTRHVHEAVVRDENGRNHFGVALFSRFPFVRTGEVDLISDRINRCIFADVEVGADTVRVYAAHLASIRFQTEDYDFISGRNENLWGGGKRLTSRLIDAFERRAMQVRVIRSHMRESPYPVVICGDFNDTPASYAYREMEQDLLDGFMEGGSGLGRTYIGTFPSFRIDYVWHSPELTCTTMEVLPQAFSDHRAVVAELGWSTVK